MLQSIQQLCGNKLSASDGHIGHVKDFYFDDRNWAVRYVVVKTGHRFAGKAAQVPMSHVERISYKESTVFVNLTKEAVKKSPEYRLVPNGTVIPTDPILAL